MTLNRVSLKLVVAGGFGVGKTTLIGAVSEVPPLQTEADMTTAGVQVDRPGVVADTKYSTTVALDFGRITSDDGLVLYLFGTPGQERFRFMWDDLVLGALGAIVLIDSRRLADSFPAVDYIENTGLPYVVAVNLFDGIHAHELDDIRAALRLPPEVPLLACDARDRASVKNTMLTLVDLVAVRILERRKRRRGIIASETPAPVVNDR